MSNKPLYNIPDCAKFTGFKPCAPYKVCEDCDDLRPAGKRILLIALEALGAVLMTTPLLHAIKRKHPDSCLTWLTMPAAMPLLENNQLIDRLLPWDDENRMLLKEIEFDIVIALDKSVYAGAFVNGLNAGEKYGFGLSPEGAIIPLNKGALYNYKLGLNDTLKFRENTLTVVKMLHDTAELPYQGDRYILDLKPEEITRRNNWAREAGLSDADIVIGFNTGCSKLFPNKKLGINQQVALINKLYDKDPDMKIVLVGGREDTERNDRIYELCGKRPIKTPTTKGLRRGIEYVDLADIVVSGDSLGMHIAVGLRKYVVVWFGLACANEIEIFGRGEKILSGVSCEPCCKSTCDDLKCLAEISLPAIYDAIINGVKVLKAEKAGKK